MTNPLFLSLATMSLLSIAPRVADAASCHAPGDPTSRLWYSDHLTPTDVSGSFPGTLDDATFGQWRNFYAQITKSTPAEACKQWGKYAPGSWTDGQRAKTGIQVIPGDNNSFRCAFDCYGEHANGFGNGDLVVDDNDFSECKSIVVKRLQTEDVCDRTADVNGPHTISGDTTKYERGASFTQSQKDAIRAKNLNQYTYCDPVTHVCDYTYKSDVYSLMVGTDHVDYFSSLDSVPNQPDSAEVDHIIPRVDVYGCGCGTNDPANAALVSRRLNNNMSNDTFHPDRIAIMDAFAPSSPIPALDDPDDTAAGADGGSTDEDPVQIKRDDHELGGCSAAGGLGGGGLGGAMIGLQLVRRRKRR